MTGPIVEGEYFDPSADVIDSMLDMLDFTGHDWENELKEANNG